MRVLKRGSPRGGWKKKVKCRWCSAKLEVEESDCKLIRDRRDGDYYEAKCPECGESITIAAKLV